ncbi:hypothetical protein A6R73_01605 [Xanthomonas translucens pv. poae]|uniref:T6SS Phospholipase effector Tle1-like catalytic domain-containing protein n=2 Tax=Xanthomonas translucens group TaxID=3390202 RepID=A0A199P6K4_9XANT|nr:hypothetical protein A6R73_01605 [Xanthomonas translucens pv. poae]
MALPDRPGEILAYYDQGVGTFGLRETLFEWQKVPGRIFGLAFGWGLRRTVEGAYRFLVENYQPGDQLYLFGFSRGAYAARALAALMHALGLVGRHNAHLFEYAWDMLRRRDQGDDVDFHLQSSFRQTFGREVKIRFMGLFDTVKSVGWVYDPVSLPFTRTNPDVLSIRHAVSIDERRAFFRQNLWSNEPKALEAWFAGVHADVGGGYEISDSQLALVSLRWMIAEALANGLPFDPDRVHKILYEGQARPEPTGPRHDSMTSAWKIAEWVPRLIWVLKDGRGRWRLAIGAMPPLGRPRKRTIRPDTRFHESVAIRCKVLGEYADIRQAVAANLIHDDPSIDALLSNARNGPRGKA